MLSLAARDAFRLFGCCEPTALELRFYSLLLGTRNTDVSELVNDCIKVLGETSEFTVAVQRLGRDPDLFLQQILQEGQEDAAAVGVKCASMLDMHSKQGNNPILKLLFQQHHYSTRRPVLLPCGSRYVQQLAPVVVGSQVAERNSQVLGASDNRNVGPTGEQRMGGQAPRQSRFRERLRAERGGMHGSA